MAASTKERPRLKTRFESELTDVETFLPRFQSVHANGQHRDVVRCGFVAFRDEGDLRLHP